MLSEEEFRKAVRSFKSIETYAYTQYNEYSSAIDRKIINSAKGDDLFLGRNHKRS